MIVGGGRGVLGGNPPFGKGPFKEKLIDSLVLSILGHNLFFGSGALMLFQECGSLG